MDLSIHLIGMKSRDDRIRLGGIGTERIGGEPVVRQTIARASFEPIEQNTGRIDERIVEVECDGRHGMPEPAGVSVVIGSFSTSVRRPLRMVTLV
jgi:hypothetical protein